MVVHRTCRARPVALAPLLLFFAACDPGLISESGPTIAVSASGLSGGSVSASASVIPAPAQAYDTGKVTFDITITNPADDIVDATWSHTAPGGAILASETVEFVEDGDILAKEALFVPGVSVGTHVFKFDWERSDGSTGSSVANVAVSSTGSYPFSVSSVTSGLLLHDHDVTLGGTGLDQVLRVTVGRWRAPITSQSATQLVFKVPETYGEGDVVLTYADGTKVLSTQIAVGGEVWRTEDEAHIVIRPNDFLFVPARTAGVKPSQVDYYVEGILGGNQELGIFTDGFYQAPATAKEELELKIEVPSDPSNPTLKVGLEFVVSVQPRCAPPHVIGYRGPSTPVILRDDRNLVTFKGTGEATSEDEETITLELDPPGGAPTVPSTQDTLAHVRVETSASGSYKDASVSMCFPFSGSLQGWYRSSGIGAFTSLGDSAPAGGEVSFLLPPESDFGELVITYPETHTIILSRVFTGISSVAVPDALNVSNFGPQDGSGNPEFPNLIKEGTTFPLLINGDLPETIESFRVKNARVYPLQPGTGWNLGAIPQNFNLAQPIISFGTFRVGSPVASGNREYGITLKSEALATLEHGDILELEIEAISGGEVYPIPTGQLAILGLPEIHVQSGDDYQDSNFSTLSDVFTLDGQRIDGFVDIDGCPDPALWGCSAFVGDESAYTSCDFEKTGCYSEIVVGSGATLGIGRPLTDANNVSGTTIDVDTLGKLEMALGTELPWATPAQRSASDVAIFSAMASGVRLLVTGDVKVWGEVYGQGMDGASTGEDAIQSPSTPNPLPGGLTQFLDPNLPAQFFGGPGAAGADSSFATATSAPSGSKVNGQLSHFQGYKVRKDGNGLHHESKITGRGVSEGGIGIVKVVKKKTIFDLFDAIGKGAMLLSTGQSLGALFASGTAADLWKLKATFSLPFSSVKSSARFFKAWNTLQKVKFPPDPKAVSASKDLLKGLGVSLTGTGGLEGSNTLLFEGLNLASNSNISTSGGSFATSDPDEIQNGSALAGNGGLATELVPASLSLDPGQFHISGAGGHGGAGGGASALVHDYGTIPFIGQITSVHKVDGGGGAGGGSPGAAVAIVAGGTAFFANLNARGGDGGLGHPNPNGAGVGGGGAGADGGRVVVRARKISAQEPLTVDGGAGGKGISLQSGIPVPPTVMLQLQVLHGFQHGGMVTYMLDSPELRFTFPDGRRWDSVNLTHEPDPNLAVSEIRGLGETWSDAGSGGVMVIDRSTRIVRMGFPDFFRNVFIGEKQNLGSAIATLLPTFVPMDIAQDPNGDHEIYVSGWISQTGTSDPDIDSFAFRLVRLDADGSNPSVVYQDTFEGGVSGYERRYYGLPSNIDFMSDGRLFFRGVNTLGGGSGFDFQSFAFDPDTDATTLLTNQIFQREPTFSIMRSEFDTSVSKFYTVHHTDRVSQVVFTPELETSTGILRYSNRSGELASVWASQGGSGTPGTLFAQGLCPTAVTSAQNSYFKESLEYSNVLRTPQIVDINGNSGAALDMVINESTTVLKLVGFDTKFRNIYRYRPHRADDGTGNFDAVKLPGGSDASFAHPANFLVDSVEIESPSAGFHSFTAVGENVASSDSVVPKRPLLTRHVLVLD